MATGCTGLADALHIEDAWLFISFYDDYITYFDAIEPCEFVLGPSPHQPIASAICGRHGIAFDDHRCVLCHSRILELRVLSRL